MPLRALASFFTIAAWGGGGRQTLAVARRSWRYSFRYPEKEQIIIVLLILAMALLSNLLISHFDGMLSWLGNTLLGVHSL
jgi:hypothetical protein